MVWAVLAAVAGAGLFIAASGPVLRRLPEPADPPADKIAYADLAVPTFRIGWALVAAGALAMVVTAVQQGVVPATTAALWWVWALPLCLLVAIDAATTWLPRRLTYVCAGLWLVALLITAAATWPGAPPQTGAGPAAPDTAVIRLVVSALVSLALFWGMWRVGAGMGFGDVRLAPLVFSIPATISWSAWWWAVVAASLLGAVWGVARHLAGRRDPYPYGPWMWTGPGVALVHGLLGG